MTYDGPPLAKLIVTVFPSKSVYEGRVYVIRTPAGVD